MTRKGKTIIVVAGVAAALGAGGAALAVASADDEDRSVERPTTGGALDRAGKVALDQVGSGRVSETEVDDEEGVYEIEITKGDGSQVDVHLGRDFNVLGPAADDDERGDRDTGKDDADRGGER
jgi:uncharacterized membrane protein YkoI